MLVYQRVPSGHQTWLAETCPVFRSLIFPAGHVTDDTGGYWDRRIFYGYFLGDINMYISNILICGFVWQKGNLPPNGTFDVEDDDEQLDLSTVPFQRNPLVRIRCFLSIYSEFEIVYLRSKWGRGVCNLASWFNGATALCRECFDCLTK